LYRGINDFKKGYQPRNKIVKDENHNLFADDSHSSFERVEEFKYLETNLTNQNSIQEEIKSRLKFWNVCYHSVYENGGACSTLGEERSIQGFGGGT
jgi:hypothetical protein